MAVTGRLLGAAMKAMGQPVVSGEIAAGIVLGPSILGRVDPAAFQILFPSSTIPAIGLAAQLGVVLYMFVVGLQLDLGLVRGRLRGAIVTSQVGSAVPFVLGAGFAVWLYPRFAPAGASLASFALFVGVAMSVTAFPVLAHILAELGMSTTRLGIFALASAAMTDVTAWCLLAFVIGVVRRSGVSPLIVVLFTASFATAMFGIARPVFERISRPSREGGVSPGLEALTFIAALAAALITQAAGVHAIFGAFVTGAVIPHDSPLARTLARRLAPLTLILLPAFFASTGLRTEIGLVRTASDWAILVLVVVVATVGKAGGTAVAARFSGLDWRQAAALGVLMNTRGLMELIVLGVGLELGVISPTLFTMLVLMAIITTLMTAPTLRRICPRVEC